MSVDDSATSDQQEQAQGADSNVRKQELPVQGGNHAGATEHPVSAGETVLRREGTAGVTDAAWHNSNTPIPAMKTKDELIEHLSEALAEMASDYTQVPENSPNLPATPLLPPSNGGPAFPTQSPGQGAYPYQHAGPSQQIRSSLPPGSVTPQTPGLAAPQPSSDQSQRQSEPAPPSTGLSAPRSGMPPPQQGQASAPPYWGGPLEVSQTTPVASNVSPTTANGDHVAHSQPQRPAPPAQHYFVLEGLAPPAATAVTPPTVSPVSQSTSPIQQPLSDPLNSGQQGIAPVERKIQFEVTKPIPVEPRDGLQIRRLIATQQGMSAAQPPQSSEEEQPDKHTERTFRPPSSTTVEQPNRIPIAPQGAELQKTVGTPSSNSQVSLPPMFGGRATSQPKDLEPASDEDQQKAHTGLAAVPPVPKQASDLRQPTGARTIPPSIPPSRPDGDPSQDTDTREFDEKSQPSRPSSQPLLTGHNFQPRQADPRSSMSALTAMPAPNPASVSSATASHPVSPLSAALASSLPSNPPTGQHVIPPGLRETPMKSSDPANVIAQGATQSSPIGAPSPNPAGPPNSGPAPSVNPVRPATSVPAPSANPLGPPTSAPAPSVNPLGPPTSAPAPSVNPLGPPTSAPAPSVNPLGPPTSAPAPSVNPLGPPTSAPAPSVNPLGPPTSAPAPSVNPLGPPHSGPLPSVNPFGPPSGPLPSNPLGPPSGPLPSANPPGPPNSGPLPSVNPLGPPRTSPLPAVKPLGPPRSGPLPAANPLGPPNSGNLPSGALNAGRLPSANPIGAANSAPLPSTNPLGPQNSGTVPSGVGPQPGPFTPTTTPANAKSLPTVEITGPQIPLGSLPSAVSNLDRPAPEAPTAPPNTPPNPQLFPIKGTSSRTTYNNLGEETGMVLPLSAPAPEPNQRISKEFGKSVPGVTPVSKPFETAAGKERREAKEKEIEALNRIQLPAKVSPKPEEIERPTERETKPRDFNPPKEQKNKRQTDPGRAARFANLLHDSPGTGPGASKSLRASQSRGALPGIVDWLRSRWRLVIVTPLVLLLVLSVSTLIVMMGKSLVGFTMSPSQKAGEEAYNEGNYDRAVNYFNEAIKAEQKKPELYHDRARANLRLQEYASAVADYTSALNLDKNFASARLDRAAAYYYLGDYMKAIADYDELLKNDPNNIDAYFGRGLSYSKLHKFDQALLDLKKVVEINPKHPGAFEDIANAYLAQNMLNEAVDAYSRSIKNNPRDANAYYMRATTYKRLGRPTEALNDFSSAIDVSPGRYEFYNDRGFTQFENAKFKDAIADLSTALELNPNYEIARHNQNAACDRIITAVGRSPKTPEELGDLAYAYFHLENYPAALAAANKALLLNSQYRPALNVRAAIELKQKRFDYALIDADNILKLKPDDKAALLTRARAYLHQGRYDKAIKDYDACVAENDNTSLFSLRERALAHLLANEGALAATDAQQFLDINGWNNSLSGPTVLLSWLAKRQLQDLDGANAVLSQAETHLKASQWPYAVIKFLKRELTLAQLNSIAHNDRERTDVRTWSAYDHLLNGLRDESRTDFNWVKRSGYQDNDDYLLATEQIRSDDSGSGR